MNKPNWRSTQEPPIPTQCFEYITWCPTAKRPGAYLATYVITYQGPAWVTIYGAQLYPSHWAPFGEVFNPSEVPGP